MKSMILCMLAIVLAQPSRANPVKSCYAHLQNDTLRIGNDYIERAFVWNNGNIITCELIDKKNNHIWKNSNKTPDTNFPLQSKTAHNASFKSYIVPSNGVHSEYFEAEVSYTIDSLSIRRVFRIYPTCSVIACDTYLKGEARGQWIYKAQNTADLKNVEKVEDRSVPKQYPTLDHLSFPGKHWGLEVVEFMDVTDRINNQIRFLH